MESHRLNDPDKDVRKYYASMADDLEMIRHEYGLMIMIDHDGRQ